MQESAVYGKARSLSMLISSMVIYGTIGIFRRYLPISSGLLACSRGLIGTLFLCLLLILRRQKLNLMEIRRNLLPLIISGGLIGFNWIFLFEAYNYTSIATATLCYYMQPILVILASPLIFRERLTPRKLFCVITAMVGMVFVSGAADQGIPSPAELRGILFGLCAALLYATVVMINKKYADIGTYEKTIVQLLSAAVVMLPYLAVTEDFSTLALSGQSIAILLLVGIVHTGIAYALYFGSMADLTAQTVALLSYIDPVTAILLSAFLLREPMTLFGVVGTVLVLGATVFCEAGNRPVRSD